MRLFSTAKVLIISNRSEVIHHAELVTEICLPLGTPTQHPHVKQKAFC